MKIIFKKE